MALGYDSPLPQKLFKAHKQLSSADGANTVSVTAVLTDGIAIESFIVQTDNTADRKLTLVIHDGTSDKELETVLIPDLAGDDGIERAVDLRNLVPGWSYDNGAPLIPGGCTVKVKLDAALGAGKVLNVFINGWDYSV